MKKLITILAGLMVVSSAYTAYSLNLATNLVVTVAAAAYTKLPLTNVVVDLIRVQTTNAVTLTLFDNFTATNKQQFAAYNSIASYTTNIAQNYITTSGITNFMTNSYIYTYYVTNAAAATVLNAQASYPVLINTTTDFPEQELVFTRGLVLFTTTNAAVTVFYHYPY